jgi:parallel beta-helix repeat protein
MNRKLVLVLTLTLLVGMSNAAPNVHRAKASGTIYIRADGSIDPPTAPISTVDNVTYTLTGNIIADVDGIVIERDNIVVDGAGYVVEGTGSGDGITLSGRTNVTIQNTRIRAFELGIYLSSSNNNNVLGNNVTANNAVGIWLYDSKGNVLRSNSMTNNTLMSGRGLLGSNMGVDSGYVDISDFINDVDASNTVDGKPVYYWVSKTDKTVPIDAGFVVLVNCTRMKVENLTVTPNYQGILLAYTTNSTITNNNVANGSFGIYLFECSNNSVACNKVTRNGGRGIQLSWSPNNSVVGNNLTDNGIAIELYQSSNQCSVAANNVTSSYEGISLIESSNNSVAGNNIVNSGYGISVGGSLNNNIVGNNITNREAFQGNGIELSGSSNNSVVDNNIDLIKYGGLAFGISLLYGSSNSFVRNNVANSYVGIYVYNSSNNAIFHNDFINNTEQARSESSVNLWDDGYPSGGNYWSDYNGTDSDQDGIGDTACVIDANNTDNYPLMGMFSEFNVSLPYDKTENVTVISNSTVSNLSLLIWLSSPYEGLQPGQPFIQFSATGENGSSGFCRLMIPRTVLNSSSYIVLVDSNPVNATELTISNSTHVFLYFTYMHSTHEVIVTIPESVSCLVLSLFMIVTLIAATSCKRKRSPNVN